jgi:cysteinyl-tRNA synthetase
MSAPYQPLDIHGGGLDLIFPHHENELAQSEAAGSPQPARFWVHNGFVQVNSEKMSKSLGNFTTIRDILRSYLPETLRFFLLGKHYRSPVDFSAAGMDEAERAQKRMYLALAETRAALAGECRKKTPLPAATAAELERIEKAFDDAVEDDLNTASALGHAFAFLRLVKSAREDRTLRGSEGERELFERFHRNAGHWQRILGLFGSDPSAFLTELRERRLVRNNIDPCLLRSLLEERALARKNRDFSASDALRARMLAMGIEVRDAPDGQDWDIAG